MALPISDGTNIDHFPAYENVDALVSRFMDTKTSLDDLIPDDDSIEFFNNIKTRHLDELKKSQDSC